MLRDSRDIIRRLDQDGFRLISVQQAVEVLQFAAEDWTNPDGSAGYKPPSTIDQLRNDPEFLEDAKDAVVAFVEFPARAHAAE